MATKKPKPISLRTYAKRRGVSAESVSKAITTGRLRASVVMVGGQPKIADAELADREWAANTRPRVDQPSPSSGGDKADDIPDYNTSRALREHHAARREAALADLAEIDVDEKKGELVPVDEVRAHLFKKFTVVKTRILGVPARIAQRLPGLAAEVVPVVESLLREALEELAAEDDVVDGEEEQAA